MSFIKRKTTTGSVPTSRNREIIFNDPRLRMTIGGRLLVRAVSYISYLFLVAATVTFLMSGMPRLVAFGFMLVLFLINRVMHREEGDTAIEQLPKEGTVNITRSFSPMAFSIFERAFDRSVITKKEFYLEVIDRLFDNAEIRDGLARLDVKPEEFKQKLDEMREASKEKSIARAELISRAEALGAAAFRPAFMLGHRFVLPSDLFSALLTVEDEDINHLFSLFSIEAGDLERALILSSAKQGFRHLPKVLGGFAFASHHFIPHRIMNRAWTSRPTPTLDAYSTDLTDLARDAEVGFMVGHGEEYDKLVETLARPINPNALLVGEAGVGKETLIQHLAFRLTKDDVPRTLFDKRLVSLELQNLVAGAAAENLHERIKEIVSEIEIAGNIILHIPDIHNLAKSSSEAYLSAADALMPVITNNAFPVLGTSYPREFKQFLESRSDFTGAFEIIHVNEISTQDAETVLSYESLILEADNDVVISFGAIKRAVTLAKRYFTDKFLPSSAEELLKSALVAAEERGEKALGPDLVTTIAEAKIHIPLHEATGAESEKLLHLEDAVHERLVDQEEAVTAVAEALREYRSGLARKGGPIASFLFVGPTGVGKTELAKILTSIQFGSEKMMVRFDMTEYQDKESFSRFIGSPDGKTTGALTEAIRQKPYSLILLDEFEKAFPDILNLFLQVFDDGRLTDNLGRTVDFGNTIIIATSNAHSDIINEALGNGESMSDIAEYLKKKLVDIFKPELLNRFSKIVVFKNLAPADLAKIVKLNLDDLAVTVREQGIFLDFDPGAVTQITKLGYDPAFGARPLRRVIDEKVRAPLASAILGKKVKKGGKLKLVVKEDGTFDFETL